MSLSPYAENSLLTNLNLLIDPKFGIIREIKEERETPNHAKAYSFNCYLSNTAGFSDVNNFIKSNAISFDPSRAKTKAIGEALERYAAAIYRKEHLITGSWSSLSQEYSIPSLSVPNYNPLNLNKLEVFNERLPLKWGKCLDAVRNKQTLIPASLIYLPYQKSNNECIFSQNTSTGLAFHTNYQDAVLNASCEIIERDAFMLHWFICKPFTKLNYQSLPISIKCHIDSFRINMGYECELFLLDSNFDMPVVIAALLTNNPCLPKFVIAASCKFDIEDAMLSALEELEQCRRYASYHNQKSKPILVMDQIKKHEHHIVFWSNHTNYSLIKSFFENGDSIDFQAKPINSSFTARQKLSFLIQKIKGLNYDLFIADITPIDLKTLGYSVVRAWIPQACPLTFGYNYRFSKSAQLSKHTSQKIEALNQLPHFFP